MSESQVPEMEALQAENNTEGAQKVEDLVLNEEETKHTIRKKVLEHLAQNKLVVFPKPYGRIPNFEGVKETSLKLLELPAFKTAKSVEVYTDNTLAPARELVLSNLKDLYVPVPRFQSCLMKKLQLDETLDVQRVVSHWGIQFKGTKINVGDEVAIDLLIVGSVAVSKDGHRIGKGGGFDDLEFAVFKEIKAVKDDTVIVTIVHDSQVFDELPKDLFKKYDIPVDFIITPTRTIAVENKLPRPSGIFWDELTSGQVKSRKLLQNLKEKHESEGRDTTLLIQSPGNRRLRRPFYWRRYPRRRLANNAKSNQPEGNGVENQQNVQQRRKTAKLHEGKGANKQVTVVTDNLENIPPKNNKKKRRKHHIDYSLRVSNINKNIRAKEFKQALKEKGIKPSSITWKGNRGVCFLHYAKKNYKKENEDSDAINNVIGIIQELKISPMKPERNLNVKVMEPITRIETVDVTSV